MAITLTLLEKRLDGIDQRLDVLQEQFDVLQKEFGTLQREFSVFQREFDAFRPYVNRQFEQIHSDIAELKQDMKRVLGMLDIIVAKIS